MEELRDDDLPIVPDYVPLLRPAFSWYVDRIREVRPYALVKRTHGFWDLLADLFVRRPDLEATLQEIANNAESSEAPSRFRAALDASLDDATIEALEAQRKYKTFWRTGFPQDLVEQLQRPHDDARYLEAHSFRAYRDDEGKGHDYSFERLRDIFEIYHTSDRTFHDALSWKDAVLTGELLDAVDALRAYDVVLVGPAHLADLGARLGWSVTHVPIHPTHAIGERAATFDACVKQLDRTASRTESSRPLAFVFQAGTMAYWLIYRLFPLAPDVFWLDLGRALDIWYPEIVERQNWFVRRRADIVRNMRLEASAP